ncbi:MAG: hypothetical protein V3W22_06805, partial [Thermoplasmata archaeon]
RMLVLRAREEEKRLLLKTHIEHVVMATLSLIKKGELRTEDFALYQFSTRRGAVYAQETHVSEDGTLKPGVSENPLFDVNRSQVGIAGGHGRIGSPAEEMPHRILVPIRLSRFRSPAMT